MDHGQNVKVSNVQLSPLQRIKIRCATNADCRLADRRPQTADRRPADLQTSRHVRKSRGKGVIDQYLGIGDWGDQ